MIGKLNVKYGVGKFSNINDGSAQEIRAGEGSGSWDGKRRETTSFLSVPFVEFPYQSPAAESQPPINFKG